MAKIDKRHLTAEMDGDFVVFLIGFRINKWWKIWKWLPVFIAMPKMLIELGKNPELGLLHARTHFGFRNTVLTQYWESFEKLHAYSVTKENAHLPAWKAFNQKIGNNGDVGIWHETYLISAGQHESVYANMPPYGLGQAGSLVEAKGRKRYAKGRIGKDTKKDGKLPLDPSV